MASNLRYYETSLMKNLLSILLLSMGVYFMTAQITINPYLIEVHAEVGSVDQLDAITATSECGQISVSVKDMQFSGGCLGNIVRTFTFTDECGNTKKAEQFITLTDQVPPVFDTLVNNITADREALPEPSLITASDNSGEEVKITYTETVQKRRVIRTWTATDQCGNVARMEQVIAFK